MSLSKSPHVTTLGRFLSQNPNYKPVEPRTAQAEQILSREVHVQKPTHIDCKFVVGQQQGIHNQGINNGSTSAYRHSINDLPLMRNNEYLEQQQQQRPSPAQGTTAPDTNHLSSQLKNEDGLKQNSITKIPSEATTSQVTPEPIPLAMMETFDLSDINLENFNLKQIIIPLRKVSVSHEDQQLMASVEDVNLNNDNLFSKTKEDERKAPPIAGKKGSGKISSLFTREENNLFRCSLCGKICPNNHLKDHILVRYFYIFENMINFYNFYQQQETHTKLLFKCVVEGCMARNRYVRKRNCKAQFHLAKFGHDPQLELFNFNKDPPERLGQDYNLKDFVIY